MSPKLPRDVDGARFARKLCSRFGYEERNQVGSHIVLELPERGLPHITVPAHKPVKIGTLSKVLAAIESQTGCSRQDLLDLM